MGVLLQVSGLVKAYGGVRAINDLSFDVKKGKVFSVIGPNGAGKTTLFNLLTGVDTPDTGSVNLDGYELVGRPPHRVAACGVSRTFQNLQIFHNMTVIENVMVGCHLRGCSGLWSAALRLPSLLAEERRIRTWADEALAFCGMEDLAQARSSELSYGVLKKLEIARALAAKPRMLLLDEPAAGLNDTETLEMCELIKKISETGVTVLLVEHNMGLVMDVSSWVFVLNYGSCLAQGTPREIQRNPQVIAAYLGGETGIE